MGEDGWCLACGDEFHLDDVGGYNPPCPGGCGNCRHCCDCDDLAEDDDPLLDDEDYGRTPGGAGREGA